MKRCKKNNRSKSCHDVLPKSINNASSVVLNENLLKIVFNDGKELIYADDFFNLSLEEAINKALSSRIHGRIFKDGQFIGYAPKASSIEELMIGLDLMT